MELKEVLEHTPEEAEKIKKGLNVYQKLLEVRKQVELLKKDKTGDGIKYSYVNEEQVLLGIKSKMNELKLLLVPSFINGTANSRDFEYTNNKGQVKKEVITSAEMTYTWIDAETGEKLETQWAMFGQNASASQSLGSGLTYANKYYLLKFFNIATTDDDPDKVIQEQEAKEERKVISSNQTKCKKLYAKMGKVFRTRAELLKKLGMTYDEFLEKFNDNDKIVELNEQMELILSDNQ